MKGTRPAGKLSGETFFRQICGGCAPESMPRCRKHAASMHFPSSVVSVHPFPIKTTNIFSIFTIKHYSVTFFFLFFVQQFQKKI